MMRILAQFTGTVRDFRRWLQRQKCQVVALAEYREKKKTTSTKVAREKSIKILSFPFYQMGRRKARRLTNETIIVNTKEF